MNLNKKLRKNWGAKRGAKQNLGGPWPTLRFATAPMAGSRVDQSQLLHCNNQLNYQLLKSKKFNDALVLAFLECSCYIQNLVIRQKESASEICVVPFSNFDNWITFDPLRIRRLFYIWTTLLITVHTFAVVIVSLHIRKYAILFHLAWLNSKNMGFTLFSLYSHKGWIAALVCDSVYSLLDSGFLLSLLYCELYIGNIV